MISCTEFIPAYSELFRYLENKNGKKAVIGFWEYISDNFLNNLRDLVAQNGIKGCWLYWNHTLNEEAADFTMELDEEGGVFKIDMRHCPSKGRLNETKKINPYHDYCLHCDVLYRRVLEPLGFTYEVDLSRTDQAACSLIVRKNKAT